jgi:hypothetical protein
MRAIDLILVLARRRDDVSGSGSSRHTGSLGDKSLSVNIFSDYMYEQKKSTKTIHCTATTRT